MVGRPGLVGSGEDLGFYPEGGGSPGALRAEEGCSQAPSGCTSRNRLHRISVCHYPNLQMRKRRLGKVK